MIPAIDFSAPDRFAPLPPRSGERFARPRVALSSEGERVRTHDGRELVLRAIEPGDVAAMQRCFTRLSRALKHNAMLSTATSTMASAAAPRLRASQPFRASERSPSRM